MITFEWESSIQRQALRKLIFSTHGVVDSGIKQLKIGHNDFVFTAQISRKLLSSSLIVETAHQTQVN